MSGDELARARDVVRDEWGSMLCKWVGSERVCTATDRTSKCRCEEIASAVLASLPPPAGPIGEPDPGRAKAAAEYGDEITPDTIAALNKIAPDSDFANAETISGPAWDSPLPPPAGQVDETGKALIHYLITQNLPLWVEYVESTAARLAALQQEYDRLSGAYKGCRARLAEAEQRAARASRAGTTGEGM